jgi:carboxylate-amine ligase
MTPDLYAISAVGGPGGRAPVNIVAMSKHEPHGLPFAQSERSTVGIEWELCLVDDETGELAQAAPEVLATLDKAGEHPTIVPEFMQNTIELVSKVSRTVGEAGADLASSARRVRAATDPMGVGLIGAGTHPFSAWQTQQVTDTIERYATFKERMQMIAQQITIFGLHTHVGVETRDKVLPILNSLLVYQPHLIALSANSPFWGGQDSGYASMRSVIFQQLPTSGIPYQFEDWTQLEGYIADLRNTGTVAGLNELHWDFRPSLQYGTLETRVCDGASNVKELLAVSALTHCLVEHLSTLIDESTPLARLSPWFVTENKWRAARYGLDAEIIVSPDGTQMPLRDSLVELVEHLQPTSVALGCERELGFVHDILRIGAGYERQRAVYENALAVGESEHDALEAVVQHLV